MKSKNVKFREDKSMIEYMQEHLKEISFSLSLIQNRKSPSVQQLIDKLEMELKILEMDIDSLDAHITIDCMDGLM